MRIVCCTDYSGQTAVTTNVAAVSAYLAVERLKHVYVMQAQFGESMLDHALLGARMEEVSGQENGIDGLIRMIKSEPVTKEMLDSCSVNLYQNRMLLLPGSAESEPDMYEEMIQPMLVYCMNAANLHYDLVLVDAGRCSLKEKQKVFEHADVIIRNLSQNASVLCHCLKEETPYHKKIFYLVGAYDPVSKYNINYIHRKYHVPMERLGAVPYNTMLMDAYSDGELLKFITQIQMSTKEEMNYYFDQELKKTIDKILLFGEKQTAVHDRRKKVRKPE